METGRPSGKGGGVGLAVAGDTEKWMDLRCSEMEE
jgi:hypothetical protein